MKQGLCTKHMLKELDGHCGRPCMRVPGRPGNAEAKLGACDCFCLPHVPRRAVEGEVKLLCEAALAVARDVVAANRQLHDAVSAELTREERVEGAVLQVGGRASASLSLYKYLTVPVQSNVIGGQAWSCWPGSPPCRQGARAGGLARPLTDSLQICAPRRR